MALGDVRLENVETSDGTKFKLALAAVEPVSDIAVLEGPDDQVFFDDADAFDTWRDATPGVEVSEPKLAVGESLVVFVLTHFGTWVRGQLRRHGMPGTPPHGAMLVEFEEPIVGGTSGGPIVDEGGAIVGVVSWSRELTEEDRRAGVKCDGRMPVAYLALPQWIWLRIANSNVPSPAETWRKL